MPSEGIDNWDELREGFVERFALRKRCCKEPIEATRIIRRENETLSNFKESKRNRGHRASVTASTLPLDHRNSQKGKLGPILRLPCLPASVRSHLKASQTELVGFLCEQLLPLGKIELEVAFGTKGLSRRMTMKFTMVRAASPNSGILGRIEKKKPIPEGERAPEQERLQAKEEAVLVNPAFLVQKLIIETQFSKDRHSQLINLLRNNLDVFTWEPSDMAGVLKRSLSTPSMSIDQSRRWHRSKEFWDEEDKEKTAFYTDQGTYCYIKMPFGLKNAGATYQRVVDSAFQTQLGRNLEACVDDMIIKIKTERDMVMDIAETFHNLQKINMKLNPKKCSFGVIEGKFLGYMVTSEGIRANPKKTKAMSDMQSPKTLRETQSLSGKLAALNRFLSKLAERSLPFFEMLKNITKENKDEYRWMEAAEKAFQELKKLIMELPTLTTLIKKEPLFIYLATSRDAVIGAKRNYAPLEKLISCLLHLSRRLRWYFEAHPIKVITDEPIKQILNKPEASGKLAKYVIELGDYNIVYVPQNAIKGQVLVDFINEIPAGVTSLKICTLANGESKEAWTLYTNRALSLKGAGAGLVLIDPFGTEYTYAIRLTFTSTNNEAEYEALLARLKIAHKIKIMKGESGMVDELPNTLWAHQIMLKTSNEETPFSLTYGNEVVIMAEIGMPTYQTLLFNEAQNEEEIRLNLDPTQERREAAVIREAKYKKKVEQYYNKRVRPVSFRVGDFVYQKNAASRVENQGKLGPNWEGPYRVIEAYDNGSYKLATIDDKEVPRTWHAINLRNCFM
nr:reverse transcriptase domain-containing protein [Tanacetum cinerariifolium]